MFASTQDVIRSLLTYTDWWQPATSSVLQVGVARRGSDHHDGIRDGLLDTIDERSELCRRMQQVSEVDRKILFLWYLKQLSAQDIARAVGISRRQCFRRRANAIKVLVDPDEAVSAIQPWHAA
jgi:DNA-directed RNA polymerase specialized sigma subunit